MVNWQHHHAKHRTCILVSEWGLAISPLSTAQSLRKYSKEDVAISCLIGNFIYCSSPVCSPNVEASSEFLNSDYMSFMQNFVWLYSNKRKKKGSILGDCNCALSCAMAYSRTECDVQDFHVAPYDLLNSPEPGLSHGRCSSWCNDCWGSKTWAVCPQNEFLFIYFYKLWVAYQVLQNYS